MATDQDTQMAESSVTSSVIENELPTYRAISLLAIASLVCGAISVFSFADSIFIAVAAAAIVLGLLAHRSIGRFSDVLTGKGIANAGIAAGLSFGVAAGTINGVQTYVLNREAAKFAVSYVDVLKSPTISEVLWYNLHPEQRLVKSATQVLQEYEAAQARERMAMEQKMGPMLRLRSRLLSSPEQKIRFKSIESSGVDEGRSLEINYYALALFEIEGPTSKDYPDPKQYAMVILKARSKGRKYEWWADDVMFPYRPASFVAAAKPVDDGHGHH